MSSDRILDLFKRSVLDFLDELIIQFPDISGDFVLARLLIKDQLDIRDLMNQINGALLTNDNQYRKMVKERNEQFFLGDNSYSSIISQDKIARFKDIWRSRLDHQDKDTVWKWLNIFVCLVDRYVASLGSNT
jgi:hypothetical protein